MEDDAVNRTSYFHFDFGCRIYFWLFRGKSQVKGFSI